MTISYLLICILIVEVTYSQYIKRLNSTNGERCPNNREERKSRASVTSCSPMENYHCMYNWDGQLVESCYEFKQVPKGNYPMFNSYATGNPVDYKKCPPDRFQGWPIKSYEIKECTSFKSTCSSEGQLICTEGSTSSDRTCKCDYKKGYIMNGGKCCSPLTISDCFCYKKICKQGQMLDAEYNCKDSVINDSSTQPVSSFQLTTPLVDKPEKRQSDNVWYFFLVVGLTSVLIACWIIYNMYQNGYGKLKFVPPLVLVGIVIAICVYYGWSDIGGQMEKSHAIRKLISITVLSVFAFLIHAIGIRILKKYSIVKRCDFYTEDYEFKIFKLLNAANNGDTNMLETLRQEEAVDMDDVDYDQRSALHVAACAGQYEAVKYLLDNNLCNPPATDRWNQTALDGAKYFQKHEKDKIKLDEYNKLIIMLEPVTETNKTPQNKHGNLESSSDNKSATKDDSLIPASHDKELKPHFREKKATELLYATKKGHLRHLKRLKDNKTVMDVTNSSGRTALHEAAENGMEETVQFLIKQCRVSPFVWWSDKRPIDCITDQKSKIKTLINEYMEKCLNDDGTTLQPVVHEQLQVVRILNAASRGDLRSLKSYRKSKYDMTLCDYDSRTALHIAVSDKQEHVVDFLLEDENFRNHIKDKKDRWGKTPFMIAQESGGSIIYYKFLKNYKELVDTENDEYRTYQLLSAGASGDVEQLERLHKRGINMNLRDYDGRTALHLAAAENKYEAVKFLMENTDANPNIPDRDNRKPILETNDDEIKKLLEGKTVSEKVVKIDNTLLEVMTLASTGNLKAIAEKDERIQYFSMESCDYFKNTPLHAAASKASFSDVEFLLTNYAVSPFVRNSFWKTPSELVNDKIGFWERKLKYCTSDQEEQAKLVEERVNQFKKISEFLDREIKSAIENDIQVDEHFKKYEPEARTFLFLNRAYRGDILAIRRFIKTDEKERETKRIADTPLINMCNIDKRTALHLAAAEGHRELVKFLLEQKGINKNPQDRWNMTPLQEAERNSDTDIVKLFES